MLSFDDYERLLDDTTVDYLVDGLEEAEDYDRAARAIYATHSRQDARAMRVADAFRDRARDIRAKFRALQN